MEEKEKRADLKISLVLFGFLFVLFLTYRGYFWRNSLPEELDQVLINAVLDLVVVSGLYVFLGRLSQRVDWPRLLYFLVWLLTAFAGASLLWPAHYLVHELTGSFDEQFRKTFALFSFQIFDAYVLVFIGLGISSAFRWYREWSISSIALNELQKEKAQAELEYLKSQINPHFVFNTLNSIFFLIRPDNDEARSALHQFSTLLRYQLYDSASEKVGIEEELDYLRNYVALQRIRLDNQYRIEWDLEEGLSGFRIPPLLLIVPLENAFKHLSHYSDRINWVRISLKLEGDLLVFTCTNSRSDKEKTQAGGIGLKNLIRRMELLYGGKSRLDKEETADTYSITLKLLV